VGLLPADHGGPRGAQRLPGGLGRPPRGRRPGLPAEVAEATITDLLDDLGIDCSGGAACAFDISQVGSSPTEALDCAFSMEWEPLLGIDLVPHPDQLTARSIMQFEIQL